MSLLPAYFGARRRKNDDLAPPADEPEPGSRDDVFNLIPPRANENADSFTPVDEPAAPAPVSAPEPIEPDPKPVGRNRHPVDMTDLSRLSIDNDGRLYWDGKPVEVRRRLLMSRLQIVGLALIGLFVAIAALGAVVVASVATHDFACKQSWTTTLCPAAKPASTTPAPPPRVDNIPA